MDAQTDRIAREAARLLALKQVESIDAAISRAMEYTPHDDVHRPGEGRVRQHLQAMTMQALGEAGYQDALVRRLESIEQLMTTFGELTDDVEPILAGRAARGLFDGPSAIYIRLYTDRSDTELLDVLALYDYPEARVETVDTQHGRANRLVFDDDDLSFVLTRCPRRWRADADRQLVDGSPIDTADLDAVRAMISQARINQARP
ncbi:MAG: hypothetical protein AAF432_08980 [Planctomycetota bacterium]